jgi:hypothetical protein
MILDALNLFNFTFYFFVFWSPTCDGHVCISFGCFYCEISSLSNVTSQATPCCTFWWLLLSQRTNAKCESDFPNKTINVAKKLHSNLPYKSSGGERVGVKSSLELLTTHLHLSLIEQKLVTMVPLNWQNDKNVKCWGGFNTIPYS